MDRKTEVKTALSEWSLRIDRLDSWFGPDERWSSGDFDTWGPKDFVAHSAEWTHRQVSILRDASKVASFEGMDEVNEYNRTLFDRHQETAWHDVLERLKSGVLQLLDELDSKSEDDLAAADTFAGGTDGVWRGFAFYGVLHSVSHIVEALTRVGRNEAAIELQRDATGWLEGLDDSDRWQGMVAFNLARALVLAGDEAGVEQARRAVKLIPSASRWIERDSAFDEVRVAILG